MTAIATVAGGKAATAQGCTSHLDWQGGPAEAHADRVRPEDRLCHTHPRFDGIWLERANGGLRHQAAPEGLVGGDSVRGLDGAAG